MSNKSKQGRVRAAARQEKKAGNVVKWIFGVLVVLAIAFAVYAISLVS
ncbi:MAG: hypothetical protein II562_01115 [Prevotella sp.]|nr:hypothetical protein [Prevotella sp.]